MRMARFSFDARRWVVSLVTIVTFTAAQIPFAAFAQNSAQAEVLYTEGQQLMRANKYAEACQRLTASFKLDPQPNTQLVQGTCFSKLGKIASAYNAFIDAASALPRGGDAQKYAADQAKALEAQLLKVKVQMQPVIPPGVAIRFDDETKTRDKDFVDLDIALDPGDHDLYITAPGKHDYTKHFNLGDKETAVHVLIVNMTDKTQAELDAEKNKGGGGNIIVEKPETSWSTVKTLGLITIVVGSAAIAGAIVAQVLALVDHSNATNLQRTANTSPNTNCLNLSGGNTLATDQTDCNSAVNYQSQALASQTAAIGIGVAGGVVLIAGIVMFLVGGNVTKTADKPAAAKWHVTPLVSPTMAGIGVGGTF
jgi:tetratricopeptide (TPR) repeat protein